MEQVTGFINEILLSWGFSQSWADDLTSGIILVVILAIAFLGDAICRHIILTAVARLVKKTKATWDDIGRSCSPSMVPVLIRFVLIVPCFKRDSRADTDHIYCCRWRYPIWGC